MFLIAIMRTLKTGHDKIYITAVAPIDEKIGIKIATTGFFDFIKASEKFSIGYDELDFHIKAHDTVRNDITRDIIKFIIEKSNATRVQLKFIYDIVLELMSNTVQHAYSNSDIDVVLLKKWYVFVEIEDERVRFTFLDTGHSIRKTIRKKFD
jgi:hypothetical protein